MDDRPNDKSSPADTIPAELADRSDYEIIRRLGGGAMPVFLARNRLMGRPEVLKIIGTNIIDRPGARDRFLLEIRSVAKLRHADIVTAYSGFRAGDSLVLAMEYAEGFDLARLVKANGPLPIDYACSFVHQAGLGLQHAHRAGRVHRDLRPGNLIVTSKAGRGVVKILEFGLAKAAREQGVLKRHWPSGGCFRISLDERSGTDRTSARHAGFHRAGTDRRLERSRHSGGYLQPGLHIVLPLERPATVSGRDRSRCAPGAILDERGSSPSGTARRAGRAGGPCRQGNVQGPESTVPDAGRVCQGAGAVLQESSCGWRQPGRGGRSSRRSGGPHTRAHRGERSRNVRFKHSDASRTLVQG